MYRVFASAMVVAALGGCGDKGATANNGMTVSAVAQSAPERQLDETGSENMTATKPAPEAATTKKGAVGKPPVKADKTKLPPMGNQVIQRSPFDPPAEVDPVPPPVEGTEPRRSQNSE